MNQTKLSKNVNLIIRLTMIFTTGLMTLGLLKSFEINTMFFALASIFYILQLVFFSIIWKDISEKNKAQILN